MSKFKKILIATLLLVISVGFIKERFVNGDAVESKNNGSVKVGPLMQSLVGNAAPTFTLIDKQGKKYTNESVKGKKVVLFFNEGLACYPACWEQMKQLSSDDRFNGEDTVALSVVTDSQGSWQNASSKTSDLASIKVAFDQGAVVSNAFGTISAPSSMHGGVPGHSYVIIDKDGTVRYVLDDPKMGINNEKLYKELSKLQQ